MVADLSSAPVVALVLSRVNAVEEWLHALGPTDPDEASLHPNWSVGPYP